jgi:uncharacterized protein
LAEIVDAHIHLSERQDDALIPFARNNELAYSLDELLLTMQEHKIGKGLLLSPPLKESFLFPNEDIIRLCRKSEGKLSPVITVDPDPQKVKDALKLTGEERKEVKGFKIRLGYVNAPAESAIFGPLYDFAESEKLPVLFHTGDTAFSTGDLANAHPLTLDKLANKRQELTMILCHFGNPWFDDVAELIYKHPNVYTDTSGLITGGRVYAEKYARWLSRKISEAVYYAGGAEKIIFGTDYPVTKHSDALNLIKRLEVDDPDKEKILWRNATRVFRL